MNVTANVTAVLVTRGDVDMQPILEAIPRHWEVVLWDNSRREDVGLYGRYLAIAEASYPVIYTQDDDVLVTCFDELLAAYEPGIVTCNYPEPWDIPWVARGALFDRDLPAAAFARYFRAFEDDDYFRRYACDGIFTLLSSCKVIDAGSEDLPWGFSEGRISTSPGWYDDRRPEIQRRCAELRTGVS